MLVLSMPFRFDEKKRTWSRILYKWCFESIGMFCLITMSVFWKKQKLHIVSIDWGKLDYPAFGKRMHPIITTP